MPDLVIARYNEDLTWIDDVPKDYRIFVYNKGEALPNTRARRRINSLKTLPNLGRETDTYIRHMLQYMSDDPHDYTIFAQGNSLEHSPDFIRILAKGQLSRDVWGCSSKYTEYVPPPEFVQRVEKEKGISLREETFDLYSWGPTTYVDLTTQITSVNYCKMFHLPNGTNIAAHFLAQVGLGALSLQASKGTFGQYAHGALFGVVNKKVSAFPREALFHILKLCHASELYEHGTIGYVMECLWLHMFGRPFIQFPTL